MLRFSTVPSSLHPTWPVPLGDQGFSPSLSPEQDLPGLPPGQGKPSKLSKGQPCQPGQPAQGTSIQSWEKPLLPSARASHEGPQKNREKRKTESEGWSEAENAECVAFPLLLESRGWQCWAGHSETRWDAGPSPGSAADQPGGGWVTVPGLSLVLRRPEAVVSLAHFLLPTLQRPECKDPSGNSREATHCQITGPLPLAAGHMPDPTSQPSIGCKN